jgi:hypothetical protein
LRKNLGWNAVVGALLIPVMYLVAYLFPRADPRSAEAFIGLVVWGLGFGSMMGAAIKSNVAVAWEREKGTLEALMLTGLGCREILRQKWRGSVVGLYPISGMLLGAMAAGLLSASLHPLAAAAILVTTPVNVAVAASVGLYFTVGARNTAVAARNMFLVVGPTVTVVAIVLATLLNTLAWWFGREPDQANVFLLTALFPPAGTAVLTFAPLAGPRTRFEMLGAVAVGTVVGALVYARLGLLLWRGAVRRFEREWEVRE